MAVPRPGSAELPRSRQARPEEVREPRWGTAKGGTLAVLPREGKGPKAREGTTLSRAAPLVKAEDVDVTSRADAAPFVAAGAHAAPDEHLAAHDGGGVIAARSRLVERSRQPQLLPPVTRRGGA